MQTSIFIDRDTRGKSKLLNVLKMRQWLYYFLGYCFFHSHNRETFHQHFELDLLLQVAEEMPQFREAVNLIISGLPDFQNWDETKWKQIHSEHQRLFIGPDQLAAPPWASVYLGEEKIIFDEHTLKVRSFYRSWGLESVELKRIPDDHIGLELEFMSALVGKAIDFLDQGQLSEANKALMAQDQFLNEHVLTWVKDYCFLLSRASTHPLYQGLALFTPLFLELDKEVLEEIKISLEDLW